MNGSIPEAADEMILEQEKKLESAEAPSPLVAPPIETEKYEDKETLTVDNVGLRGTALLKSLLSTSTASSAPPGEVKMITTTEVTDETSNLRKILYQPEKEKKDDKELDPPTLHAQLTNANDARDDDDRRLVIDISDEEKETKKSKSMPVLNTSTNEDVIINGKKIARPSTLETKLLSPIRPVTRHQLRVQENQLPKSITYNIEPTATSGVNNSVKIDILAPAMSQSEVPSVTDKSSRHASSFSTHSKCSKLSSIDELNVISHEIDKQITKKTNCILELLKEYLNGSMEKNLFLTKMSDATETSLPDLISVAKKLIKRHKFEPNPNHKEFMRIKFLQFPTASKDLVIYFDNLLPSLSKDKFISMIKFYEIIIKEMFNLNKTKILQYLIDFMIVRKNAQLDLLNYNFQVTSAPNLKQPPTAVTKFQLPDSTQNQNERRAMRLMDTSYNFIIRSDPIYLQAGSSFVTNHRDVISCRMSTRKQMRSFERRPFDNNILRGRRIARRLVRSPEDEKLQAECMRSRFSLTPQSETTTPLQQMAMMRSLTPIIVESDTPPPSVPSEPPSPPQHKFAKTVQQLPPATLIKPSRLDQPIVNGSGRDERDEKKPTHGENSNVPTTEAAMRQSMKKHYERSSEPNSCDPLQNGQISIQEIQTLSQNGTEIIPTSILKNTIMNCRPSVEQDRVQPVMIVNNSSQVDFKTGNKFVPRGFSHDDSIKPSLPGPKAQKRRQSCHERIMMPADNEEKSIENSVIGQNYMEFLNFYENEISKKKQQESQLQRQQQNRPYPHTIHEQPKRVRFSMDVDADETLRNQHGPPPQPHFQYPPTQSQHMENQQRIIHFQHQQGSDLRSPLKPQPPPINYQYYQHQFERELRERGYDHRIENQQEPNRPLELVSHVPPERYHQNEQQRVHYPNNFTLKQIRPSQEKPTRLQPRMIMSIDSQQAAMMAAYRQLQSLHRDPSSLTSQQYAEHLKHLDHLKHMQPSAFTAYQRNVQPLEGQRAPQDYYTNTQELHGQQMKRSSPVQYQISSSSSREDSPNSYEEQSLQRKLKSKMKSSKYIEPNQLTKPFYNPAHSTYYSEPFALTKNKTTPSEPELPPQIAPTAFHPPENQRQRSPVGRNLMENATNAKHYQWFVAQAQANAHAQNLAIHNQPQRPIPRPPVPAFIEPKANGSSHHPMTVTFQEQPTEFLRSYYANQKNF